MWRDAQDSANARAYHEEQAEGVVSALDGGVVVLDAHQGALAQELHHQQAVLRRPEDLADGGVLRPHRDLIDQRAQQRVGAVAEATSCGELARATRQIASLRYLCVSTSIRLGVQRGAGGRTVVDLEAELLADLGKEHHKVARLDQLEPVVKLALALRDELKEQLPKRHAVVRRGLRVGGE